MGTRPFRRARVDFVSPFYAKRVRGGGRIGPYHPASKWVYYSEGRKSSSGFFVLVLTGRRVGRRRLNNGKSRLVSRDWAVEACLSTLIFRGLAPEAWLSRLGSVRLSFEPWFLRLGSRGVGLYAWLSRLGSLRLSLEAWLSTLVSLRSSLCPCLWRLGS